MKITDLRIGNYLQDGLTKELLKVIELTEKDSIFYVIDRAKFPLPDGWHAEPIPLTEEILLKCPQAKHNEKSIITKSYILPLKRNTYLSISDIGTPSGFIWLFNEEDGKSTDLICLYNYDFDGDFYMHQLQNLFYIITGQELNVQL